MQTKLNALITAMLVLIVSVCFGQVSIGPRIAGNYAKVYYAGPSADKLNDITKYRTGMGFGAAIEIGLSDWIGIQPEVYFNQLGFVIFEELEDLGIKNSYKLSSRINYTQMPLLAKVRYGGDRIQGTFVIGPHFGLGVGKVKVNHTSKRTILDVTVTEIDDYSQSWKDLEWNRLDFGFTGGIGIAMLVGPGHLGLDCRYQIGIGNLLAEPMEKEKVRHRNIQAGISYLVPISR